MMQHATKPSPVSWIYQKDARRFVRRGGAPAREARKPEGAGKRRLGNSGAGRRSFISRGGRTQSIMKLATHPTPVSWISRPSARTQMSGPAAARTGPAPMKWNATKRKKPD